MRLNCTLASFLFCVAIANAQVTPAPASGGAESIIRSETRIVLVDASVTDKKNRFIRDLTRKDFQIREDGKEQKITSFSLESAGVSPDRSTKHYIILYFDATTLSASQLLSARQDALKFVDGFASPDRNIAVIAYGGAMQVLQNFTSDPARVKDALNKVQTFTVAALAAPAAAGRIGRGGNAGPVDASSYRRMLASVREISNSVAAIRGRKAFVLFSGGPTADVDINSDIAATIDTCNRANVAVYGVNGRGLIGELRRPGALGRAVANAASAFGRALGSVSAGDGLALGFQRGGRGGTTGPVDASGAPMSTSSLTTATQDVVRALAAGTGGLMLGTSNNLPDELGRVAQEQDEYYLIGYTPAIDSAEGTCHTLLVKVDRGGTEVRARKGYCTSKPAALLTGKPVGTDLEAKAAGAAAGNMAVTAQLPWFYAGTNVAQVNLVMDIVPAAVKLEKAGGKLHGEFDLLGVAYKPDGSVGARLSDTVKLDFDDQQQADAFLKRPYRYANQFEIVPGKYDFRIAVSAGEHGLGKADVPLTIDSWNRQSLGMSALALSHDAHPVAEQLSGLAGLLVEREHPMVSNGTELTSAANSRFGAAEKGFFFFEVYEPASRQRQFALRVRILDRATGQPVNDSGPIKADGYVHPADSVVPIAMRLPIAAAGLRPGAYRLEVSVVTDAKEDSLVRTTDFDVN